MTAGVAATIKSVMQDEIRIMDVGAASGEKSSHVLPGVYCNRVTGRQMATGGDAKRAIEQSTAIPARWSADSSTPAVRCLWRCTSCPPWCSTMALRRCRRTLGPQRQVGWAAGRDGHPFAFRSDQRGPQPATVPALCCRCNRGRPADAAVQPERTQPGRYVPPPRRRTAPAAPLPAALLGSPNLSGTAASTPFAPAGVRLPLPAGYSGAVLECRQQEAADAPGSQDGSGPAASGPTTSWVASGVFSHLHYFNHDAAPLRGDPLRRCLEWGELAAEVHRAIDPAAVATALAAGHPAAS